MQKQKKITGEEVMFISGETRDNDTIIILNTINYNARILQDVLFRIDKLEKEKKNNGD